MLVKWMEKIENKSGRVGNCGRLTCEQRPGRKSWHSLMWRPHVKRDIRDFSTLTSVSWTGLKNWWRPCKTKKCDVCYLPGFPGGSAVKKSTCNAGVTGNAGSIPCKDPLEEGTATHSSILAWRIPRRKEPGRLRSMGRNESNTAEATEHAHMHPIFQGWRAVVKSLLLLGKIQPDHSILSCGLKRYRSFLLRPHMWVPAESQGHFPSRHGWNYQGTDRHTGAFCRVGRSARWIRGKTSKLRSGRILSRLTESHFNTLNTAKGRYMSSLR